MCRRRRSRHSEKFGLLIDIQSKIQQGKGAGYRQWEAVFNLKIAAQTLIYLQEHGIGDYDVLAEKSSESAARFHSLSDRIKELEGVLGDNAALQKQIVTYTKTRAAYAEYRKAGYSKRFRSEHEADILLHQTAKKFFDEQGFGKENKLPCVTELRSRYADQLAEKKQLYAEYKQVRNHMRELLTAKANADRILGLPDAPTVSKRAPGRGMEGHGL